MKQIRVHLFWLCVVTGILLSGCGDTDRSKVDDLASQVNKQAGKIHALSEELIGEAESCKNAKLHELAENLYLEIEDLTGKADELSELVSIPDRDEQSEDPVVR